MNVIDQLPEISQIIFDMKWAVLVNRGGNFVTSDDPVTVLRPQSIRKHGANAIGSAPGLLYDDSELTLPLSKERLLLAGWQLNEDSYLDAPDDIVEKLNHRTITKSSEKIVAKSQEQAEAIRDKYTETKHKNKDTQL